MAEEVFCPRLLNPTQAFGLAVFSVMMLLGGELLMSTFEPKLASVPPVTGADTKRQPAVEPVTDFSIVTVPEPETVPEGSS